MQKAMTQIVITFAWQIAGSPMAIYQKNSFCSYCGMRFTNERWPRLCNNCGKCTYQNPLPVSVVLLPVGNGLVVVERNIEPRRGQWALPGGFIELGESWQTAGAREIWEEAQIPLSADQIRLFDLLSAPDGTLLIFGLATPWHGELPVFTPTAESAGRYVIELPTPLAFPLHTQVVQNYFNQLQLT